MSNILKAEYFAGFSLKFWRSFLLMSGLMLVVTISSQPVSSAPLESVQLYQITTLASGLKQPSSMVFLPNRDLLISEKAGQLRVVHQGELLALPVCGIPTPYTEGQGGLLDIALHPRFAENHLLYLTLAMGDYAANATHVVRGQWQQKSNGEGCLVNVETIFKASPSKSKPMHFGGRLAFLADGTLLITVGEGSEFREKAQRLDTLLGKVIRISDDGKVPGDNPFVGRDNAMPQIWSYGHRNPQGLLVDQLTQIVYEHEHGPQGGDEINVIRPGGNYGWPIATYGIDYSGARISPYQKYPGTVQPLLQWTPSPAPSGFAQCRQCLWPQWEGDLFVGMLAGKHIRRVELNKSKVNDQEILFKELKERFRDVRFGDDGALYLLTDSIEGRLLKVTPSSSQ